MSGIGIVELLTALGGYECIKWLITFWVHRKQEKRLKRNEADQGEVATENAIRDMYDETLNRMRELDEKRINEMRQDYNARIADIKSENAELYKQVRELSKEVAELNKQNLELLKDNARKDDIILDKTAKNLEIQELRVEDARQIGKLEKSLQFFKSWKCFREYGKGDKECDRREPQQNPPLKYNPLDGETSDDAS